MRDRALLTGVLVLLGLGWGLCIPLSKIAVSGGYQPLGLIFWQVVIVALFLGVINVLRRRGLPLSRATGGGPVIWRTYLVIACLGALLPDVAYYRAAQHLPAGVLAILISSVPMFAFPIALMLGNDRFQALRIAGLLAGMAGIFLLIGPEASLPDAAMATFIPLALIAPLCYASEVNYVARWGTAGLDPIQALTGASIVAALIALPLAVLSGQWIDPRPPWGLADAALLANAVVHALVYAGYVWLTGRAGSVFAAQASYLVTLFGMLWSMGLLSERYSGYVWAALGLMILGLALVQPRPRLPPVTTPSAP
ncbi:drug/metabolite transporter (DMT)-like permease [Roseovarius sp. MBR-154]|jgi:drug/metabolite transporter (DMT)-like permease